MVWVKVCLLIWCDGLVQKDLYWTVVDEGNGSQVWLDSFWCNVDSVKTKLNLIQSGMGGTSSSSGMSLSCSHKWECQWQLSKKLLLTTRIPFLKNYYRRKRRGFFCTLDSQFTSSTPLYFPLRLDNKNYIKICRTLSTTRIWFW